VGTILPGLLFDGLDGRIKYEIGELIGIINFLRNTKTAFLRNTKTAGGTYNSNRNNGVLEV
jgi:hypothetical protein